MRLMKVMQLGRLEPAKQRLVCQRPDSQTKLRKLMGPMTLCKGVLICLLAALFFALPQPAEAGFVIGDSQGFTLTGETVCTFSKDTEESWVEVPLLLNKMEYGFAPYLTVHTLAITPKPTTIIADANGNLRAVYLNFHNRGILQVRQKAVVETGDVKFVPNKPYASDGRFAEYLLPSQSIESDSPIIKQKAAQVTKGLTDSYDMARYIFRFVQTHMTFDIDKEYSHQGALSALRTGKGTCDDHAALMVALLRASGIPARIVGGYAVDYSTQSQAHGVNLISTARHEWLEFYLPGEGWIPADPNTRKNKGNDYPKWEHFGGLNPSWEYIPDSVGKTVTTSYVYLGGEEAPEIKERVTINKGSQEIGSNWYLVMSDTKESLFPAPYYLQSQTVATKLMEKVRAFWPW